MLQLLVELEWMFLVIMVDRMTGIYYLCNANRFALVIIVGLQ